MTTKRSLNRNSTPGAFLLAVPSASLASHSTWQGQEQADKPNLPLLYEGHRSHKHLGKTWEFMIDDRDDDANPPSNGESLYHPTPGLPFSMFPHCPDHQSAPIKDLSDDPHQIPPNSNDQPTSPNQPPVIMFHLHQTYCLYFDLSHTLY